MPFTLVKGTFHVKGYSPDGDSIRFKAKRLANWDKLGGPPVEYNAKKHAQLRIEGIDTLETHFENHHQPLEYADAATSHLLELLGITNVEWNLAHTQITKARDGTSGYVLSREADHNRRPISFLFTGNTDTQDGSEVWLDVNLMKQSVNYQMLQAGLAYPTYYKGLFPELRNEMTAAVKSAQTSSKGLWPQDTTTLGFDATMDSITKTVVILPKLFRRLVSFLGNGGAVSGFEEYLKRNPDPLLIVSTGHFTNLDTIVVVDGNQVKLTQPPENLIFIPT
jgi:endonuclease YncB( thermonuclease family)